MTTSLDRATLAVRYVVDEVVDPSGSGDWPQRLEEIGFLPGEHVAVLERGAFGDPLAIRVGHSIFALRRSEAACVRIRPLSESGGAR